jgi:hypothetical protein
MMGLGQRSMGAQTRSVWRSMMSMGPAPSRPLMSPPAAKTLSPPVSTMALTLRVGGQFCEGFADSRACKLKLSALVALGPVHADHRHPVVAAFDQKFVLQQFVRGLVLPSPRQEKLNQGSCMCPASVDAVNGHFKGAL